jgi:CelD/BcsL family acetyltransferase involved in cellulose biosynthesis
MHIDSIRVEELAQSDVEHWRSLQTANDTLDSPFFHPRFSIEVGAVRPMARVAIFRENSGKALGFLPYERMKDGTGRPIGGRLSDYQAIVGPNSLEFSPRELLRSCKLSRFQFDHWLISQPCFSSSYYTTDGSPFLDLSQGFDHYESVRREMGADELKQTQRKTRKVQRELGELRLVFHDESEAAWNALLQWKSEQYERTKATDIFAYSWTRELLKKLERERTNEFGGVLNTLYAGDTLLAVHYGLFGAGNLHWWFPTYSQQFAKYSPGRIMLLSLARQCADFGIHKIDLGRGMTAYKVRAMTGATPVGDGAVDTNQVRKFARDTWRRSLELLRKSPLRLPARVPGQVYYRLKEWLEFR